MPRIVCDAFLDPSNTASSLAASPSRCINEYLESITPGEGKSKVWSVRRPGLHPFVYMGSGPVRGMLEINQRLFAVAGTKFAEVLEHGTLDHVGLVANDLQPVSMASNGTAGHQVLIISGGFGYIFDLVANTLTQITDADFPENAACCEFMDGYFLVLKGSLTGGGTRTIQWSALEDGLTWDALDVIEVSEAADNVTSIIRNHREIWALGNRTTEVLYDTGDPTSVFAPMQGVFLETGAQGIFTPQRVDNSLMWMAQNENGQGMVVRADGYVPKRVSTHAVEVSLQRAAGPTLARACAFQINGHTFYCLTIPSSELTWVYDITTDRWFEWGHWNPETVTWVPFAANCHSFNFGKRLVGSRYDGTIYQMSQDFVDDQLRAVA